MVPFPSKNLTKEGKKRGWMVARIRSSASLALRTPLKSVNSTGPDGQALLLQTSSLVNANSATSALFPYPLGLPIKTIEFDVSISRFGNFPASKLTSISLGM